MPKGMVVAVDGFDGCGKTTILQLTAQHFWEHHPKLEVVRVQNPGTTDFGKAMRLALKNPSFPVDPVAERFAFAADFIQALREVTEPAKDRGALVLCDRWAPLTDWAYGLANHNDDVTRALHAIHDQPLGIVASEPIRPSYRTVWPDLVCVVRIPFEVAKDRNASKQERSRCRIESRDEAYLKRVCDFYNKQASKDFMYLDGTAPASESAARIIQWIEERLEANRET